MQQVLQNRFKNKSDSDYMFPTPIFDEFLQAFIITRDNYSFYLDLNGNFDERFRTVQWTDNVLRVQIANPFIVGYLDTPDNTIEVRNIFNPTRITQKYRLEAFNREYVTTCVA